MSTDIVERLREAARIARERDGLRGIPAGLEEAAAEILRLRSSLSEIRERAAKVVQDEAKRQDNTARTIHVGTMAAAGEIAARAMEKAAAAILALPDGEEGS